MKSFKEFLKESIYDKVEDKARTAAEKSKDGTLKFNGETSLI